MKVFAKIISILGMLAGAAYLCWRAVLKFCRKPFHQAELYKEEYSHSKA